MHLHIPYTGSFLTTSDRMLFKDGGGPMRKKNGDIHPEAILMIVLKMAILGGD